MARTLELKAVTGLTLTVELVARGTNAIVETITMTEKSVAKQVYTGTIVTASAGMHEISLKVGSNYIGTDEVWINATDGTTSRASSMFVDMLENDSGVPRFTANALEMALDQILVESGISASSSLTNDTGTQLTSINARQAMAAMLSALAGLLSGVATNAPAFKPAGKPAGNTRIAATQALDGRTAITLKVPD